MYFLKVVSFLIMKNIYVLFLLLKIEKYCLNKKVVIK